MEGMVGRLEKTETDRQELTGRNGTLDRRSRALLIMVDGLTDSRELRARGEQLGLDSNSLRRLLQGGLIRLLVESVHETVTRQSEEKPSAIPSKLPGQRRSLAAARMYLIDVAERMLGRTAHPIKTRLIEAMDSASIEQVFQEFLDIMRGKATPAIVAHIEERFLDVLPLSNEGVG
ncbi:hypothetical protein [Cupriavidus pinatubonensis]|uniref:Uncharacterized protein n=1 Tax=Cupriavidus pinatubonensis TaxID=248026 RepID=A0ABM8Y370_9BURK|nr:hypothetical protein [Cupriavidus pinatubonensis]CAG9187199.1 hypothetical protein LMG23994_06642 [Cupriavidus pinatubonensis]